MDPFITEQPPADPADHEEACSQGRNTWLACPTSGSTLYVSSMPGVFMKPRLVVLIAMVPKVTGFSRVTPNAFGTRTVMLIAPASAFGLRTTVSSVPSRSEERRVGKECRSG